MNPEQRYEKTLIAILFFSWGTVFLDRMSQFYLAPYIIPEFHLTHQQVGTLASALAIAWALSTLFFGALSDRFGRLRILIPAMFAFSLLSWLSGMVHSYHQLLLVRALMGVAEGPTWSVITALIEESSPASRRGRNVGLVVSGGACGFGGRPCPDDAGGRALGLAARLFCRRRAGNIDGSTDVEVRARAAGKIGRSVRSCSGPDCRLFFPAPLSKSVALLYRLRQLHDVVIPAKCFCATLYHPSSASVTDDSGIPSGRHGPRQFLPASCFHRSPIESGANGPCC